MINQLRANNESPPPFPLLDLPVKNNCIINLLRGAHIHCSLLCHNYPTKPLAGCEKKLLIVIHEIVVSGLTDAITFNLFLPLVSQRPKYLS